MSQAAVEQEYHTALKTALALAEADLSKTQPALAAQLTDPKLKDLWPSFSLKASNESAWAE